ncbi:MAG: hypothetical protein Q4A31_11525 [Corynebacterium sp.]|uniref:hypothetical protein n=1 Tax=Corynebacterium sp. TaxID=1720 RepID=UPI0026DCDD3F|nr:hypothetical protein [Corynebacterium sp.]MDO4762541.1 hypothetical protein [Corynebacterium sp.]
MSKRFGAALTAGLLAGCFMTVSPAHAEVNRLLNNDCKAVDAPVSISVTRSGEPVAEKSPVLENDELTYTFKVTNKGEADAEQQVGGITLDKVRVDGVEDPQSFDKFTWPNPAKQFHIDVNETATAVFPGFKVTAEDIRKGTVDRTFEIPVSVNNGNTNICSVLVKTSHPLQGKNTNGALVGGIVAAIAAILAVLGGVWAWFAGLFR